MTDLERLELEIAEYPERFDFGDAPAKPITDKLKAQYEAASPQWIVDMIAEAQKEIIIPE